MRRSKPTKARAPPATAPTAPAFDEETDLRRFALKRSSLKKALECLPTTASTDAPEFAAVDYSTDAPTAPQSPAVSPLSGAPRRPSVLKPPRKPTSPPFQRMASSRVTSTLSTLELPEGCTARFASFSIDSIGYSSARLRCSSASSLSSATLTDSASSRSRRSSVSSLSSTTSTDSSSSSDSRRSSLSSVNSTESDVSVSTRPRLRAIPHCCVSGTYSLLKEFKHFMIPGPTFEELIPIEPIPMTRDTPRCRLSPAFEGLGPGEKRMRFMCPPRECRNPLWPDFDTQIPDMDRDPGDLSETAREGPPGLRPEVRARAHTEMHLEEVPCEKHSQFLAPSADPLWLDFILWSCTANRDPSSTAPSTIKL
ncbi:hypothetical protein FB451DRAFT_1564818 [Mycena latifolia]|nr:hypothetical protein FB451DRAFT_1564818 [Mycena latifolia]